MYSSNITLKAGFIEAVRAMAKVPASDPARRGEIYRECREIVAKYPGEVLQVLAANSLGSMSGDLIALRALDLLKFTLPALSRITTDFSGEAAFQGQVVKSRIIGKPTVTTYNDVTGWSTSDASTTDVPVTIGQPIGVQIAYGNSELAKTGRNLFSEQVEACHYSLGKYLVDTLYTVITPSNFPNTTTKPTASVARADLVGIEKKLATREVGGVLTGLVNGDIYERLNIDPTLVSLGTFQRPEVITAGTLPDIAGFGITRAINLPTANNLTGFFFRKDALVLATRVPSDYTKGAPAGAAHGSVSVVTNPDTGLSVQKADFVDHNLAKAFSRIAISAGVAKGNPIAGELLVSA